MKCKPLAIGIMILPALLFMPKLLLSSTIHDPFVIPGSPTSAAYQESGAFSSLLNPALPGPSPVNGAAYSAAFSEDMKDANHHFLLRILGFSFHYSRTEQLYPYNDRAVEASSNLFSLGRGFFLNRALGFGAGFSFAAGGPSEYSGYRSLTAGMLFRPLESLSLGYAYSSPDTGSLELKAEKKHSLSAALKTFNGRVVLGADAVFLSGHDNPDMFYHTRLLLPWNISLALKTDSDFNFSFGLSAPIVFRGSSVSTLTSSYRYCEGTPAPLHSIGVEMTFDNNPGSMTFASNNTFLRIRLTGEMEEAPSQGIFDNRAMSFHAAAAAIRRAADDASISGIVIFASGDAPSFGQSCELAEGLDYFQSRGKKLYSYISAPSNRAYYICCKSDRILVDPDSPFSLNALSANVYFLKGLLENAGARFHVFRQGKYKSAFESLTLERMSEPARENLTSLLENINTQYVKRISEGRNRPHHEIEALFASGYISPEEAVKAGFADSVSHPEDYFNSFDTSPVIIDIEDYAAEVQSPKAWGFGKTIAVICLTGSIVNGKASPFSSSTGAEDFRKSLEAAFSNPAVKAAVIRVDSGGGSASASNEMLRDILRLKKSTGKPVVFSFGNTAASGGYLVACTGDRVFASPVSVTGSIGVISGKLDLNELYSRAGINKETFKLSPFADMYSESRGLSVAEARNIQKSVDFIYERFTKLVSEARDIPENKIDAIAGGRVFSGSQALKAGLIDEHGGLTASVAYAASLAQTGPGFEVRIWPEKTSLELTGFIMPGAFKGSKELIRLIEKTSSDFKLLGEGTITMMPYLIEIK